MCCRYHIDIIGSITYCQGYNVGGVLLDQTHYICLLLRRHSASYYCWGVSGQLQELRSESLAWHYLKESVSGDYSGWFPQPFRTDLEFSAFSDLVEALGSVGAVNQVHFHLFIEQFAREADIYCCFRFVSSQHPHLNSCLLHCQYRLVHVILQFIFNCRSSNQWKSSLYFFSDTFHFIFSVLDFNWSFLVSFTPLVVFLLR